MGALKDLKVGDRAIVTREFLGPAESGRHVTIEKCGHRWFTVSGGEQYDRREGYSKGLGRGQLHTEATLAEARELRNLLGRAGRAQHRVYMVPIAALRAWVEALESAGRGTTK